jgi:hypothetical protein
MKLELLHLYYRFKICDHAVLTFKGNTKKDLTMNSQIDSEVALFCIFLINVLVLLYIECTYI